jgi:hypothetical protein
MGFLTRRCVSFYQRDTSQMNCFDDRFSFEFRPAGQDFVDISPLCQAIQHCLDGNPRPFEREFSMANAGIDHQKSSNLSWFHLPLLSRTHYRLDSEMEQVTGGKKGVGCL